MTSDEKVPRDESTAGSNHPNRRQVIGGAAALGAAALGSGALAACSSSKSTTGGGGATPDVRHQTLFLAGLAWSTPTNFNPLNPTALWPSFQDQGNFIYEELFGFDIRDGSMKGILATSVDVSSDNKTITVKLQPAAKWQDGQPVTADDIVYTYELGKRVTAAPWNSAWVYLTSVVATDAQTVTFTLNPQNLNPGIVKQTMTTVPMLPKHLWTGYETQNAKIVEFTNMQPVGSGPYKVDSANAQQLKMVRDDNYWGKAVHGKLPAPKWIVHPIFKDNAAGDLAFERGEVDASQQFTPQIWKMWQTQKLPVKTWYDKAPYHLPGSIPMLVVNCKKKGLDNPAVRRAIAHAIDYQRIANTAMSSYSDPAQASVIIPKGAEQQYFDADNVAANGWTYDLAKAKTLLQQAGGLTGSFTVQTPSGWSDWQAAVNIIVENLKALGLNATAQFPQPPQTTTNVNNGNFDFAIWYVTGAGAASPWQRFRDVLDIRGVNPQGQSAFYNYGRFSDPQVAGLLDQAAVATGAQLKDLFKQLDTIFMKNAPMIPIMYRPLDFFEVNESTWTGFPTSANPSAPPMFRGDGIEWLYNLTPKTK